MTPEKMIKSTKPRRRKPHHRFPGKLHRLLRNAEDRGMESIVSWTEDGLAFMVHKPDSFIKILSVFFKQSKFSSFRRQLSNWRFEQILEGPNEGAFYHPLFVKGKESLCARMSRRQETKPTEAASATPCNKLDAACFSKMEFPSEVLNERQPSPVSSSSIPTLQELREGDRTSFAGQSFFFLDRLSNEKEGACQSTHSLDNSVLRFQHHAHAATQMRLFQIETVLCSLRENMNIQRTASCFSNSGDFGLRI